jgi:putative transposase
MRQSGKNIWHIVADAQRASKPESVWHRRVTCEAFERLEPCARKRARTVLRGGCGGNAASLLDWTKEKWLYLAVVVDLFSRRVVGWSMGPTLERSLVLSALDMVLTKRQPSAGLLCHSDRGSQYASGDYQQRLKASGIVCSMSRKGNCWDNAPTESFFASFKKELVYRTKFVTHADAKVAIFDWIEVWYNRKRRHSSLGYVSPEVFESQYQQHLTGAMAA